MNLYEKCSKCGELFCDNCDIATFNSSRKKYLKNLTIHI